MLNMTNECNENNLNSNNLMLSDHIDDNSFTTLLNLCTINQSPLLKHSTTLPNMKLQMVVVIIMELHIMVIVEKFFVNASNHNDKLIKYLASFQILLH